jgi:hypothetical protein
VFWALEHAAEPPFTVWHELDPIRTLGGTSEGFYLYMQTDFLSRDDLLDYSIAQIDELIETTGEVPAVNQVKCGYLAAGLARRQPEAFDGLFLACTAFRIHPEDRELPATATVSPRWLPSVSAEFRDHLAAALGTPWEAVARDIDTRLLNLPPADDS